MSGRNVMEVLRNVEQFEIPSSVEDFPAPVGTVVREALPQDPQRRTSMVKIATRAAERLTSPPRRCAAGHRMSSPD